MGARDRCEEILRLIDAAIGEPTLVVAPVEVARPRPSAPATASTRTDPWSPW